MTATIVHRAVGEGTDEFGDPVLEVTGTEDVACNFQQQWSREMTANEAITAESFNLYLPAGTQLGAQDRVRVEGVELEVYGPAGEWGDFAGNAHHVEAVLRRVV